MMPLSVLNPGEMGRAFQWPTSGSLESNASPESSTTRQTLDRVHAKPVGDTYPGPTAVSRQGRRLVGRSVAYAVPASETATQSEAVGHETPIGEAPLSASVGTRAGCQEVARP